MERTGFEQWKPREVARLLALVETERRYYQEMVAALPVALAVLAPDRAIVSANRAFRRLTGLSGDELRQKTIEQILPSDELIERIRSAHVYDDIAPFLLDLGQRRFRLALTPIRSWEDEMQAETLLMIEPIGAEPIEAPPLPVKPPEPVEPEAAGQPAAEPTPSIDLSGIPAILWQADASTFAFTHVAGAAEDLLGYSPAHWLAEPLFFSERIHPDDRETVMALYRDLISRGGEATAEYRAVNASGDPVWLRETIRVPVPGEGEPRLNGVTTAIGERRQLEARALEAGRIEALRGLAARLAHDLNNPLMIVMGYSEELQNSLPEDDPKRADLTQVLVATSRMMAMTGALLSFTRPLAKPPVLIAVTELAARLETRLRAIATDVEIAFPRGPVWTLADEEQLEEAITSLAAFTVENTNQVSRLTVICFTDPIIERIGTATLSPGAYTRLDIRAEGQSTEPVQNVFESILPAKEPHKSSSAVTRAYLNIRQWGGDVAFSSDATGSAFTIHLPYAEAPYSEPVIEPPLPEPEPAAAEPEAAPVVVIPEPEIELSEGTILVVEDEPGIRGLVRKILKRERYEVLEAGTGEEALAAASEYGEPIDLLLTDVILPGVGGREVAESLAAAHPDLRVLYMSGFTDDEGVRAGQFPPGSRFLQKPFTLSALVGAVKEAFAD